MAAPETQNPNATRRPLPAILCGDAPRPHEWVTYVMALGVALGVVGASLLLVSNFWPHTTMIFIGGLATASVVCVGLFGYFTLGASFSPCSGCDSGPPARAVSVAALNSIGKSGIA